MSSVGDNEQGRKLVQRYDGIDFVDGVIVYVVGWFLGEGYWEVGVKRVKVGVGELDYDIYDCMMVVQRVLEM